MLEGGNRYSVTTLGDGLGRQFSQLVEGGVVWERELVWKERVAVERDGWSLSIIISPFCFLSGFVWNG